MKTIVIANHKGGCAKTTTAINLAVILAGEGARVLAIDLDPQGNLSTALGADLQDLEVTRRTSHRMMLSKDDPGAYLLHPRPRLDLIPACLDHDAEALLENLPVSKELRLRGRLSQVQSAYDYCVIDTPPALRAPTLNALAAADLTLIPIDSSIFALIGINQLMRMIVAIRSAHRPEMMIVALSTLHNPRQNFDKAIRHKIQGIFQDNILETTIPRATGVSQAIAEGKSVYETDCSSAAAFAFFNLTTEIRGILDAEESELGSNRREPEQGPSAGAAEAADSNR